MRNLIKFRRIIAIGAVIALGFGLGLAGCATTVPIKSVRMPTINGMDTVKKLGIKGFENRSGIGGSDAAQLTNYLTDSAKSRIPAIGIFEIVAATDPNADGVFFGELRSIATKDSQSQSQSKDKNGNTVTTITYRRDVAVEFVYGVKSTRTGAELGVVPKKGTTYSTFSTSTGESPQLTDLLTLAKKIVDSQMRDLEKDIAPTIVSENRKLMDETSKDKEVKQKMKDAQTLVKNNRYEDAVKLYDQIGEKYGSVAARTNAQIVREAIASDFASSAKIAQLDSERSGLTGRAVKNAVESLNSKLPEGTTIMVMKQNSTEANLLNDVLDQITAAIVQAGKLKVVDRSNQALINAEQKFQLSGDVDDNSAVSIGRQLGAKYAVLCWISGASSSRKLNLRVLNIETAQITDQTNFEI